MINWDAVRERGADGRLTADETDALACLAEYAVMCNPACFCEFCETLHNRHHPDCPIAMLEHVTDDGEAV